MRRATHASRAARALACLSVLLLSIALPAGAQGPEIAESADAVEARRLFAEGVRCIEEHETACAERAFRGALALRDAPAIRYNLASALFELGRYPEAARLVGSVLGDEATPADIRAHTLELERQLTERAAILELEVTGAPDGAEVRVDGEVIGGAGHGAVAVAPGARALTVVHAERELARVEVEAVAGARIPVALAVAPSPEAVAQDSAPPPEEPAAPPPLEDWRVWVIGAGAAVIVIVIVVAVAVAAVGGSVQSPIVGDFDPGVLRWD